MGNKIEGLENKQGGAELGDMLCLILKLFSAILVHYRCVTVMICLYQASSCSLCIAISLEYIAS